MYTKSTSSQSNNGSDIVDDLKRIQRVHIISPGPEEMKTLIKEDLDSAINIYQIPRDAFVDKYQLELDDKKVAKQIWDFAKAIVDYNSHYVASQLSLVARYDDDKMSKDELRDLIKLLCKDKRLHRSFRVYFDAKDNE